MNSVKGTQICFVCKQRSRSIQGRVRARYLARERERPLRLYVKLIVNVYSYGLSVSLVIHRFHYYISISVTLPSISIFQIRRGRTTVWFIFEFCQHVYTDNVIRESDVSCGHTVVYCTSSVSIHFSTRVTEVLTVRLINIAQKIVLLRQEEREKNICAAFASSSASHWPANGRSM